MMKKYEELKISVIALNEADIARTSGYEQLDNEWADPLMNYNVPVGGSNG